MTTNDNDRFFREGIIALFASFICILICIASIMGFTYAMLIFHIVFFVCISLCISYLLYLKHIKLLEKEDAEKTEKDEILIETKPYGTNQRKKRFLTPGEREFKELLSLRLPSNIEIYCNVAIRSILEKEVNDKLNMDDWDDRSIAMMYVDYALIDKNTEGIILIIELDGFSHSTPKAKKRCTKNDILTQSRIPIIRISDNKRNYPIFLDKIIESCMRETA